MEFEMEKRIFIFYKDNIFSILVFFYYYRVLLILIFEFFWSIIFVFSCLILLVSYLLIGIKRMVNFKLVRNVKLICMCNKYRDIFIWNGRF